MSILCQYCFKEIRHHKYRRLGWHSECKLKNTANQIQPRLMQLTKSKKFWHIAHGSVPYLLAISGKRCWIEHKSMPATLKKNV